MQALQECGVAGSSFLLSIADIMPVFTQATPPMAALARALTPAPEWATRLVALYGAA